MLFGSIRIFLGIVFLVTGISKIPIFQAFVYSITELTLLTGWIVYPIGVFAIALEITIGLGLLLNRQVRALSGILSLLMASFLVLLSAALFRFEHYICTCFGVLGLALPVHQQILVDLALLNLSVFLFLNSPKHSSLQTGNRFRAVMKTTFAVSLLWSGVIILQPSIIFGEKPDYGIDEKILLDKLSVSTQPRLVMMVDFGDFYCPDCLDDFVGISASVSEHPPETGANVSIVVRRIPFMEESEQRDFVDDWRQSNGVHLPMIIDTGELFDRSKIRKSAVLLFDRYGNLLAYETLPMGSRRRNEVVQQFLDLL